MSSRSHKIRAKFWERPLGELSNEEWEALCDGCGKCCLNKLEDEETGQIAYTRVACRLLNDNTCRCAHYSNRKNFVPDCVVLTPQTLDDVAYWLPETCAYRLRHRNEPLPDWHPLISGDHNSVHKAGISVRGMTVSEFDVSEEDWEDYLLEETD